jgi:hypothetical protein
MVYTMSIERYWYDAFAIGPMKLMHHYMTRWYTLGKCPVDRVYHSGTYLAQDLQRFTNVTHDSTLPATADVLPRGHDSCH